MTKEDSKVPLKIGEALHFIGIGRAQYLILFLTAGGYLAVCSEILVCVFSQKPCWQKWGIDNDDFAWLFFVTALASIVGGFVSGRVSDKYGRQLPFIAAIGISGCFGIASAFAPTYLSFIILRSFVSFGNGALFAVDFVLLLEFLPVKNRANFIIFITVGGSTGAVFTAGMAWIFIPNNQWQIFLICSAIPLLFVFLARLCFRVESPRFLLSIGKYDDAIDVLNWIAQKNGKFFPFDNFTFIVGSEVEKCSFSKLVSRQYATQTVKLSFMWLLQSFGYWGCTAFIPNYFTEFGAPVYLNMFVNICAEFPGFFLAIMLINISRLKTVRFFSFGSMVSLLLMTFLQNKVAVSVLSIVSYFFMVPIYAIMEVYTPECYPTLLRSTMMSLVNFVIAIPNMVAAFSASAVVSSSKRWLFPFVWAMCFFLQFLTGMTLKKETVSLSLDESTNNGFLLNPDGTKYGTCD